MKRIIAIAFILFIACKQPDRVWDNPYDPRSDRSLWSPENLQAKQRLNKLIELSWVRKGREFDGYRIDKSTNGVTWSDSIATIDDYITKWIDTLDLKVLVQNPSEYSYRLYAYADTNRSNEVIVKIRPALPGMPLPVEITNISYNHIPNIKMSINWTNSDEPDFKKYNLYTSLSDNGEKSLIKSINYINILSTEIDQFSVLVDKWYWIDVEDTTGQKTLGKSYFVPMDPKPIPSKLDSIKYAQKEFLFSWEESKETDLEGFVIEQIQLPDTATITLSDTLDPSKTSLSVQINEDVEHYYRLQTIDIWGHVSFSQVRSSSSYQRVVTLDYIREVGDDIKINSLGPLFKFSHLLSSVNAHFPVWIQNGDKVFALINDGTGLVVDEDGRNFRKINGTQPQDISFNKSGTMGVFTGVDHNIYITYLDKDAQPSRITDVSNNEWYSDPEFIGDGTRILYAQRKHKSNNNVGTKDLFTMDLDGKNVVQISDAPELEKFTMPRMSPNNDEILYVKENDGVYLLKYPNEKVGTIVLDVTDKVIPETSQFYRNIRWSPDGDKAILWEKVGSVYNLYLYESGQLRLLQIGGRYADWISNEEVMFRHEPSNAMLRKKISLLSGDDPSPLINDTSHPSYGLPWMQLQPRQ